MYEKDFNNLMATWKERIRNTTYNTYYTDGVNDCLYELKCLLSDLSTSHKHS